MDERLIVADPAFVRRTIARLFLDAPMVDARLGDIQLAAHQVDAAARILTLLDACGGALLADATGLGKTFVAIAVARRTMPALVVAPAALRNMWRESLGLAGASADIVSYEALSRGTAARQQYALIILDEAHHARNPRSRRYAALAEITWGARVLLLTATPVHNRARDMASLLALFLGSCALSMSTNEMSQLIVRRASSDFQIHAKLPRLAKPEWIDVPGDAETLQAIRSLPPAVPPADGSVAHALLVLGLIRAWTSSEFALREMLKRRLRRGAAFASALEDGRQPERQELEAWLTFDDAIQLGFPELFATGSNVDVQRLSAALSAHVEGVRAVLRALDRNEGMADGSRMAALRRICDRHSSIPVVAFSQFADTARATFRATAGNGGVALVTGSGARVASGNVAVDEIVRGFDVEPDVRRAFPLRLLIATDVLSEGLSLRRAGVLVHLDLPWTIARLEQRVGRLRRLGSIHRDINVYAIGPPIGARELVQVIRALQRKARLSSGAVGASELEATLPLLGPRLRQATERKSDRECVEQLRLVLSRWMQDPAAELVVVDATIHPLIGVALVSNGAMHRLVAVEGTRVSETVCDVLRAARAVSTSLRCAGRSEHLGHVDRAVRAWMEQQRAHEMVQCTTISSDAHARVLALLNQQLDSARRADRASLGARVARLRDLVTAARGAGAERALQAFLDRDPSLDFDELERLLAPRVARRSQETAHIRLEAILIIDPAGDVMATVREGTVAEARSSDRVAAGEAPIR